MLVPDWRRARPASHQWSGDEVLLTQAAETIAARNPPMTPAAILGDLMRDYWRGCLPLFTLRRPRGCDEDQHGNVIRPPDLRAS